MGVRLCNRVVLVLYCTVLYWYSCLHPASAIQPLDSKKAICSILSICSICTHLHPSGWRTGKGEMGRSALALHDAPQSLPENPPHVMSTEQTGIEDDKAFAFAFAFAFAVAAWY